MLFKPKVSWKVGSHLHFCLQVLPLGVSWEAQIIIIKQINKRQRAAMVGKTLVHPTWGIFVFMAKSCVRWKIRWKNNAP